MRKLEIAGRVIDEASPCYVIAEIGHNHQGDLGQCKRLFAEAKRCGADAVKLQKRDNRRLYAPALYDAPYDNRNAYGRTYGEHREALEFGQAEYEALVAHAKEIGIAFFATAFDEASADFLAGLDMPAYKVASGDLTNTPLLRHIAQKGKPIILSTGGGTLDDVVRAYRAIMPINPQLCVLQCTSGYPASVAELDLRVIETYRQRFPDVLVGLSSHENGIAMPLLAYALGARVVEKHFTLNRAAKGSDHAFSLSPDGLRRLTRDLKRAHQAMGDGVKKQYASETAPLNKMRKVLVAARDLSAGAVLAAGDFVAQTVGKAGGVPPCGVDHIDGVRLTKALAQGEALTTWHLGELAAQAA